jgi:hypothetical protein
LILHAALMFGLWEFDFWPAVTGMALFLDLLLIAVIFRPALDIRPLRRFSSATIFWVAVLFGVGLPAALTNGIVVMWRAEAIAGDRPYCIQYASQTDAYAYESARTLFDLSALKMQQRLATPGGWSLARSSGKTMAYL